MKNRSLGKSQIGSAASRATGQVVSTSMALGGAPGDQDINDAANVTVYDCLVSRGDWSMKTERQSKPLSRKPARDFVYQGHGVSEYRSSVCLCRLTSKVTGAALATLPVDCQVGRRLLGRLQWLAEGSAYFHGSPEWRRVGAYPGRQ